MEIIEYQDKYLEDIKDLLTELEEYIISIDKDNLDHLHEDYHDKMALVDLEEVNNYYFTLKVFKAIESFTKQININYKILMDNKEWSI